MNELKSPTALITAVVPLDIDCYCRYDITY